jgi:Na+-transporting methylmalonyl-CoA/oxaloacetate decarboxylase gamma subunit
MHRRFPTRRAALLLVLALLVVAVAGCGSDSSSDVSSAAPTAASDVSADQIVKESEAKMAAVTSASFTADFGLEVQGDAEKMTDPTAKALLSQGVTLHAEGQSANDPTAVDMTMSLGIAGQNLEFGMMSKGSKSWIEYQGTWYALDSENAKSLDEQAATGAAPTEQLKSLGIDPSTWGTEYQLAGTQDLNGVEVYHVTAVADAQKLADSLAKAAEDPSLQDKLGGSGSQLGELSQGLTQDTQQAEELSKSLKGATVDYWIGVEDQLMYKAQFGASMDMTNQKDMEGVDGMSMQGTVTMSGFDEPVKVTPPQDAQSFEKFMTQLFGGMMGGSELTF